MRVDSHRCRRSSRKGMGFRPQTGPTYNLQLPNSTPLLGSAHPLPPGLPGHSRGLIVANQQLNIDLLNTLELLTEVGATANPLCLGPDHLRKGKPNSLAWVGHQ